MGLGGSIGSVAMAELWEVLAGGAGVLQGLLRLLLWYGGLCCVQRALWLVGSWGHAVLPWRADTCRLCVATCAMPIMPIMSRGETMIVRDLDRVSPIVMRLRQSSVSSVGEPYGRNR